jgi:hypothetical protein
MPRHRVSAYCYRHSIAVWRFGHPHARRIKNDEYRGVFDEVSAFLDTQLDHPAVIAAIMFLESWTDRACVAGANSKEVVAANTMIRLHQHGVIGLDILKRASALVIYTMRNPRVVPNDEAAIHALAYAVMSCAPRMRVRTRSGGSRYAMPSVAERRALGGHLRRALYVFFSNLNDGINEKEMRRRSDLAALHSKFSLPMRSRLRIE